MNIIKEGYPSGFSNFSDSIIAYFESVLTIFLLLTDSQFLKKLEIEASYILLIILS